MIATHSRVTGYLCMIILMIFENNAWNLEHNAEKLEENSDAKNNEHDY